MLPLLPHFLFLFIYHPPLHVAYILNCLNVGRKFGINVPYNAFIKTRKPIKYIKRVAPMFVKQARTIIKTLLYVCYFWKSKPHAILSTRVNKYDEEICLWYFLLRILQFWRIQGKCITYYCNVCSVDIWTRFVGHACNRDERQFSSYCKTAWFSNIRGQNFTTKLLNSPLVRNITKLVYFGVYKKHWK